MAVQNDLNLVQRVIADLQESHFEVLLVRGWAEELHDVAQPRQHDDIDVVCWMLLSTGSIPSSVIKRRSSKSVCLKRAITEPVPPNDGYGRVSVIGRQREVTRFTGVSRYPLLRYAAPATVAGTRVRSEI
jgi:hypothetical protein